MSFRTNSIAVNNLADARIVAAIGTTVQGYDINLQNIADLVLASNGSKALVINSTGDGIELSSAALGSAAFLSTGTAAGNIPVLDGSGKLATSVLPGLALTNVLTVATVAELPALSTNYQQGDIFVVTDVGETYVHNGGTAGTMTDFTELLTTPASVDLSLATGTLSVGHGGTGATTLTANGILFGNGTDAVQATAAPTTADTFLKWTGSAFAWAAVSTTKIASTDGRAFVGTEETGHDNKVVIAADAATDGSKIVATFAATDAADAGERLEFTHTSGEVQIKAVDADATGDVDIRLVPQGAGQVYIGEVGDGSIQADSDSTLTLAGGTNTGTLRGDLILKGGAATGTNVGGNVILRGGDSASGTDGNVVIQDASAKSIATFSGVASAVNHLTFTSAATGGDVVIGSAGSDTSVDIVVDPAGTGLLVAASGYDMSTGPALAFATKGYVDGINTALDSRLDALEAAPATQTDVNATVVNATASVTLVNTNHVVIMTFDGARTVTLPAGATVGKMFVIKDGAGVASNDAKELTVVPNGAETIDGQASIVIDQDYESLTLIWNGTQWNLI